jgi:hypothetical protein
MQQGDLMAFSLKSCSMIVLGEVVGPYQDCTDLPFR